MKAKTPPNGAHYFMFTVPANADRKRSRVPLVVRGNTHTPPGANPVAPTVMENSQRETFESSIYILKAAVLHHSHGPAAR